MAGTKRLAGGQGGRATNLGVGGDPVGGLRVVVALFDPLAQEGAAHRLVPVVAAGEAERVAAAARHRPRLDVLHADHRRTVRTRTPPQ